MKANIKTRWIAISIGILAISGIIGILIWYSGYSKQEEPKSIINQIAKNTPAEQPKQSWKRQGSSNEYASNKLVSQQAGIKEKKGRQAPEAGASIDLISKSPEATKGSQETPAELLQRYLKVTNSPEFQAEFYETGHPLDLEIQHTYSHIIKELEDKQRELENNWKIASEKDRGKIQEELENVKANLWEIRVEECEKAALLSDAVYKVFLKRFTNEEIWTAHEEMWRTMTPPPGALTRDEVREMWIKASREAIIRLKAKGWVPASPDERWYVN